VNLDRSQPGGETMSTHAQRALRRLRSGRIALLAGLVTVLTLCALVSAVASGATSSKKAGLPSQYKIGVEMSLTGGIAPFDQPALAGIKMAVGEINAKGGIGGKSKIVLTIKNDRSDSGQAAANAQTLASQGIDFMMLPGDPSVAIPAGRVAQSHHIPMMTTLASLPTQRQAIGDYFFAGDSGDNLVAAAPALWARSHGIKTAYTIVGPDAAYTQNFPRYFAAAFKAAGGKVVGTDTYKFGTTDFSPQIQKIRKLNPQPDAIETAMFEPDLPAFIKQLRAAGVTTKLICSDASDTPATKQLGKLVNEMIFSTYGFPVPGSPLAAFYQRFKKHYGHLPTNVLSAIGYDTIYVMADAIKRAGTNDAASVVKALNATKNYHGVLGTTSYGTGTTAGFPDRPIAIQKWVWNDATHSLKRQFLALVTVPPSKVPAP
jgi:branched-chain amino acid transport system substrate-binding protein